MQIVPILAAGGGDLWPFIVGGVFLLIKWLASKGEESTPPPPTRRTGPSTSTTRPPANSEEERTRRFLEALGLPTEAGPTSTRQTGPPPVPRREPPTSLRQAPPPPPPRPPVIPPVPPIVHQQQPRRKKQKAAPVPASEPPPNDWLPAPTTEAGKIKLPELDVPEYHEFRTTTSEVHAIPFERTESTGATPGRKARPFSAADLRAQLRHRDSVRSAILLREILGPPPGLQTR